jgi:hypothetical protein
VGSLTTVPENIVTIENSGIRTSTGGDFLASADGLALTTAFMRIEDAKLRRCIVDLLKQIAGDDKG